MGRRTSPRNGPRQEAETKEWQKGRAQPFTRCARPFCVYSAAFFFRGSLGLEVGLRPLCCGNGWFHSGQRKAIIRTHLLSGTSSDYIGLVRVTGLEPARFAAQEPKSCASANSATPAYTVFILITGGASYVKQPLEEDFL